MPTKIILTFTFFCSFALAESAGIAPPLTPSPTPFWKAKVEVYRRMKEERATIVSAHSDTTADGQKKFTLITAGIMKVPVKFCHEHIIDFDNYSHFLPYIQESSFDKTTQNVFIHGALLGSHIRMTIHVKSSETAGGEQIIWESVSGGFVGMMGTIGENRIDSEHTEISMNSSYVGDVIPIPTFILNWGLEVAGQKVANAMREHIEDQYEKSKKH
jgi:hypothetical protein